MRTRLLVAACLLVAVGAPPAAAVADGHPAGRAGAPVVRPPVDARFDYQLGGAYTPAPDVVVVTRDRTERPAGVGYDICYLNAFQTQPGELGWWRRHHPGLLLRRGGKLVHDPGWPDEVLLDTRTAGRRHAIAAVLDGWAAGCARRGYDAVEPDNLDSWTRSHRLLTRSGNLDLARRLVGWSHRHGLAVAQKNTSELTAAQVRAVGFDFAVAEDCEVYAECEAYQRLFGDHVLEVEYADGAGQAGFERACTARSSWSVVLRDRDLVRPQDTGYVRAAC